MFKIRDLFVSLAPSESNLGGGGPQNFSINDNCAIAPPPFDGPAAPIIVVTHTECCTPGIWQIPINRFPSPDPVDPFEGLRTSLQLALQRIEAGKEAFLESQTPQSLSEVQVLEAKLQGALDKLSTRKAELLKKIA